LPSPPRINVDVQKLLSTYEQNNEKVEVILVARDPEASILGKIGARHCSARNRAIEEQDKAYSLLLAAKELPHVHVLCYEDLVHHPDVTLAKLRKEAHITGTHMPSLYDGNAKYKARLPAHYPCSKALKAYRQLCPNTDLAKEHPEC
jgi:hypothetical protein